MPSHPVLTPCGESPVLRGIVHKIVVRTAPLLVAALLAITPCTFSQPAPGTMAYTVSMPQPPNHLFHVTLRIDGLKGEFHDLKMPAWHPGYYRLIDYAKKVSNFRAADGAGRALPWEKVTKNTWRVAAICHRSPFRNRPSKRGLSPAPAASSGFGRSCSGSRSTSRRCR
jgi:hypothetical protein